MSINQGQQPPIRSSLSIDARVFLDWVEIPYNQIMISASVGTDCTAVLVVEPDPVLLNLLPTTPVHIFVRNPVKMSEFILAFEGFYASHGFSRTYNSAHYTLTCHGTLGLVGAGSPVMATAGQLGPVPISGGQLVTASESGDIQIFLLFLEAINRVKSIGKSGDPLRISAVVADFVEKLSSFNLGALLGTYRTDFLSDITSIDSTFLDNLVNLGIVDNFVKNTTQVSPEASVLDMVREILFKFGFTLTHNAFPSYMPQRTSNRFRSAESGCASYLVSPEISYGFPPLCNVVFANTVLQMSSSRNILQEPTRKLAATGKSSLSGLVLLMSPTVKALKARGYLTEVNANNADVFSVFLGKKLDSATGNSLNPFHATVAWIRHRKLEKGTTILQSREEIRDISGTLLPIERLKGIQLSRDFGSYSELYALASLQARYPKTARKDPTGDHKTAFIQQLQDIADYQLAKEGRNRSLNLTLQGNIFIVPGFPLLLLDNHMPAYGYVSGVTYTFESDGNHTIEVGVSECLDVSDALSDEVELSGVNYLATPTWGLPEVSTTIGADAFYAELLQTQSDITLFRSPQGGLYRAFDYETLRAIVNTGLSLNRPLLETLKMNSRGCINLETYSETFGVDFITLEDVDGQVPERSASDCLFTARHPDKLYASKHVVEILNQDNYVALYNRLKKNREYVVRYARAHKRPIAVKYTDRDPFNTRFSQE